ncbi:hypothetical protein C8R47DRAFT_1223696 [Mycena vitilis]|nr:hypothetical protein C8R47DRAFT_1223696 [Mycena vitilis]
MRIPPASTLQDDLRQPCTRGATYSPDLRCNERLIERSPRATPQVFTGKYVQSSGRDTVFLTGQDVNAERPTYCHRGIIDGFLSLENSEMVRKVIFEVKGTIDQMVLGCHVKKRILNAQYNLWSAQDRGGVHCPCELSFAVVLPTQFEHNGTMHRLPPSYLASYAIPGGFYAKVLYTLSLTVVRTRRSKLSLGTSNNMSIIVPFNYCPRTRPVRPILRSADNFLAELKVMPEEWHQMTLTVQPRPNVALPRVDLHLFTPASNTLPLGEPIPVHIQLIGPVAALREFLPDARGALHSLIEAAGRIVPTRITTVRAFLRTCPPGAASAREDGTASVSIDWVGELRGSADISVGSFDAGMLQVQDFIVVDVLAPAGPRSHYAPVRRLRSIRLVTDSCPM